MPKLEEIVHPNLLDVIGNPDDFQPLAKPGETESDSGRRDRYSQRHAILARIHYLDNDEFTWLLLIKPSMMGDEATDVIQYQRTHPLFPQEPTTDQYFDEAQWESYRKLGEHIGNELFTPPVGINLNGGATWSPSDLAAPQPAVAQLKSPPNRSASPLIKSNAGTSRSPVTLGRTSVIPGTNELMPASPGIDASPPVNS